MSRDREGAGANFYAFWRNLAGARRVSGLRWKEPTALMQAHGTLELMANAEIQFITDDSGDTTAVIVPIALWREIESERETGYLLKSETMKQRLLESKDRAEGIPLDGVVAKLRI